MSFVQELKKKVIDGYEINREEAVRLLEADLDELTKAANEIREKFHGNDSNRLIGNRCSTRSRRIRNETESFRTS